MREPKPKIENAAEEPKKRRASAKKADESAVATAEPEAPAPVAAPKPKRERKPRPEGTPVGAGRAQRKVREGLVVSNRMQKTVVVEIARRVQHPLYGKVVIRSNKFKAHDELSCDIGDRVEIMETRPVSKEKRWRVTQILEKVK